MSTPPPGTASRVWTALHEYVTGQDRRRALRAALDLGPGKVEVLIKLADGPPAELASLDSEDLARLDEIITRLRAARPDRTTR